MTHTQTDDKELFALLKNGEASNAMDKIIEKYDYIPALLSRRFAGKGLELDDIYQSARIGLINAAKRFDPARGILFSTYATATVLGEIKRLFRDKKYCIRVPRQMYEIFSKANQLRNSHLVENGTLPSHKELADALNVSPSQLSHALCWGDSQEPLSLDLSALDGEAIFSDCIGMEDDEFLMIENKDFIKSFMKRLDEKEQTFVRYRFYDEMTQSKIAELMGISQMNVSRMEKRVLLSLREFYEKTMRCS